MFEKIKGFFSGKKTYLLALAGICTAIVAWVNGELTDFQVITAVWAAIQSAFIRMGVKKAGELQTKVYRAYATTAKNDADVRFDEARAKTEEAYAKSAELDVELKKLELVAKTNQNAK